MRSGRQSRESLLSWRPSLHVMKVAMFRDWSHEAEESRFQRKVLGLVGSQSTWLQFRKEAGLVVWDTPGTGLEPGTWNLEREVNFAA